jgi:hypothetical protein
LKEDHSCLQTQQDHENLLYLTDSEVTLQTINKWIGGGSKLNLVLPVDTDILRVIVKTKTVTLVIKVKTDRGYLLNKETDVRVKMGRMKEE